MDRVPRKLSADVSEYRKWLTSRWLSLGAADEAPVFTAAVTRRPETAPGVAEHVGDGRGSHLLHLRHGFGWPAHPTHCNRQ